MNLSDLLKRIKEEDRDKMFIFRDKDGGWSNVNFHFREHEISITLDDNIIFSDDRDSCKDYKTMAKSFIGETISDFFCNGFFGSRTFDLTGAEITRVYESDGEGIVIEVKKLNGKYDYGYFEDGWDEWRYVYEHLDEWVNGLEEE